MIAFPASVRVWLATGRTDMRRGFDRLALLVQEQRVRAGDTATLNSQPMISAIAATAVRPAQHTRQQANQAKPIHADGRGISRSTVSDFDINLAMLPLASESP
jgi:hypothetical protein